MILLDSSGNRIANRWGAYGSNHPDCGYTYQPYQVYPDGGFRDNSMTLTFGSSVANVSRVVFGGIAGTVPVHQIVYDYNVPEPGTLALIGLGLVGIGMARRKRLQPRS